MPEPKFVTVSQINFFINNLVSTEPNLKGILVMGEVSDVSEKGDMLFFTLKDENAQLSAVCYGFQKTYRPKHGEKVLARGSVTFYQKGGRINYSVYSIEPYGLGKIHIELQKRKERLQSEGLFDAVYKKPISPYPQNICVVTSVSGAVINDIVTTVRKYNQIINITVVDVRVQGEGAAKDIVRGLGIADISGSDVVILARGGGSFEDLLVFSDEDVVRAVFAMKTPVISAIGHETDYSLCDFAADLRALTPTAAAETVAYDTKELKKTVYSLAQRAGEMTERKMTASFVRTEKAAEKTAYLCERKLKSLADRVNQALAASERSIEGNITQKENDVKNLIGKLNALNPAALLQKGYFKATKDHKPVNSATELSQGDLFTLYAHDGKIIAEVKDKILNEVQINEL